MGFLSDARDFVAGIPRALFGDQVDTGWGIAFSIYVTVVTISFVIGGYSTIHELIKALDIRFKKEKLDRYNRDRPDGTPPRKIDWVDARKQQVRSLRFTLPFGIVVLAALYWWVRESFTLKSYFTLTVAWLAFFLFLRAWWIATVIWTERKLAKKEPQAALLRAADRRLHTVSVGWALKHYLHWGLQKSTVKQSAFFELFKVFNPIIRLFRLRWLRIRLLRPLFSCTLYAVLWPLSTVIAVFYLPHEFEEKTPVLKPSWASRYAAEPTYGSGAIPDTPGDAAAARS